MKIKKVIHVFQRFFIKKLIYMNTDLYLKKYVKYLKKIGIHFIGDKQQIKYIDPSVYFDGTDYSLIKLGDNVTISREVMLLTHDYSITSALCSLGKFINRNEGELYLKKEIIIGDNCFIGARASILPGTVIGNNSIIGAGTVVKGFIPSESVVIGNPCKIISHTNEYAEKILKKEEYFIEK